MNRKTITTNDSRRDITIYKTTDYSKFNSVDMNRAYEVDFAKSKTVAQTIDVEVGNIIPAIVTASGVIIDGQHRLSACEHLQAPFNYVIAPDRDAEKLMLIMNSTQKSWSTKDYVNFFAKSKTLTTDGYKGMQRIIFETGVSADQLCYLSKGTEVTILNSDIKKGNIDKIDEPKLLELARAFSVISTHIKSSYSSNKNMGTLIAYFVNHNPDVPLEKLVEKVVSNWRTDKKFKGASGAEEMNRCLNLYAKDKHTYFDLNQISMSWQ